MVILNSKEELKLYVFYFFIVGILYFISFIRYKEERYEFGFLEFTRREGFGLHAYIMTIMFVFYFCCRLGMILFCWWFNIPTPLLVFSHG